MAQRYTAKPMQNNLTMPLHHLHPPGQDEAVARFFGGRHEMRPDSAHDMMLDDHWRDTAAVLVDWLQMQGLAHQGQGAA